MSYMGAHNRNRRVRGPASEMICPCGSPAREWAYQGSAEEKVDIHGRRYSNNPFDYLAMCKPCHQRLDTAHITHCPKGHPYDDENLLIDAGKRKCKTCVYERNRRAGRARTATSDPTWRQRKNDYQRRYRAQKRAEAEAAA